MAVEVQTVGDIDAAQQALAGGNARFFAGGTLLMCAINYGDQSIARLVRCTDPALMAIRVEGERIRLGSGVTMAQIIANRDLAALAPAAAAVGGPAIRSAATVGGNLFASAPYGDFATALLALGATVELAGGTSVAIDDFLRDRDNHRARLVTAVLLPRPASADALRFTKVTRVKPKGAALLSIAAFLPSGGGRADGLRIAYGNMARTPIRANAVERALDGRGLDEASVAQAAGSACEGIEPPTDALASSWYRREIVPVHLKRLLLGQAR